MANIKSQIKRNHQNEKRRLRNRTNRGAARTAVKDARTALVSKTDSIKSVLFAISMLDKAANKGAIHPRNAARRKGRLMKQLNALGAQPHTEGMEAAKPAVEKTVEKKAAKPAKAEKVAKPVKESKPKAEKKTTEKKPAAKKATAKK